MSSNLAQELNTDEQRLVELERTVAEIRARNLRVEQDKAWEICLTRRVVVAALTYIVAVLVLWSIALPNPLSGALIPTAGYLVSTLTVPWAKKIWIKRRDSGS